MKTPIYNCHMHTFTAQHVPDAFLPFGLTKILTLPGMRRFIIWLFTRAISWQNKDLVVRYGRFLAQGDLKNQRAVFERIQQQYPDGTRFIVLSMDMEYMGAGKSPVGLEAQLEELARLHDAYPKQIIPFCAVDPRRPQVAEKLEGWLTKYKCKGVKLYPNLGYYPDDPVLKKVYAICERQKIPVLAHCSPGGIRNHKMGPQEAAKFANPANYKKVLEEFPKLHFCLAHFGGSEEWEKQLNGEAPDNWLSTLVDMLSSGKYPNLYTDVSYTMFCPSPSYRPFNYFDFLKVLLSDKHIREHTLFGTDYYMVKLEKASEKEVSIALRSHLGESLYFQLAYTNPKKYLYLVK